MIVKVKVRKIGTSSHVILSKDALSHLGVNEGNELFLLESPKGCELTPYAPEFEKQLENAGKGMNAYKNALREPAK